MKIVFFGTSGFAVSSLDKLLNSGHEICCVLTRPDKKKGRHLKVGPSPVGEFAAAKKVPLLRPEFPDSGLARDLRHISPDLFIVIAYGHILKKEILDIPKRYSINVHASLLPKYRGAAPINWAIMNGEAKTGVTIIRMNEFMDAGSIIERQEVDIDDGDDSESLGKKLADIGGSMLIKVLGDIDQGRELFREQDDNAVTYARKLVKSDGLIDWSRCAPILYNMVRGLIPWPGAYTYINGKKLTIWKASLIDGDGPPGTVINYEKNSFIVFCGQGALKLDEVQLEGRKRLKAGAFIRGFRGISPGTKLG